MGWLITGRPVWVCKVFEVEMNVLVATWGKMVGRLWKTATMEGKLEVMPAIPLLPDGLAPP